MYSTDKGGGVYISVSSSLAGKKNTLESWPLVIGSRQLTPCEELKNFRNNCRDIFYYIHTNLFVFSYYRTYVYIWIL